jgi:hypothetical protein
MLRVIRTRTNQAVLNSGLHHLQHPWETDGYSDQGKLREPTRLRSYLGILNSSLELDYILENYSIARKEKWILFTLATEL